MRILALHIGHNSTAALAEDGCIAGVLSQEKLDDVKNSAAFPSEAVQALLRELGWGVETIDRVAVASNTVYPPEAYAYLFSPKQTASSSSVAVRIGKRIEGTLGGKLMAPMLRRARSERVRKLEKRGAEFLADELQRLGLGSKPIQFVEHHTCHARAAYHTFVSSEDDRPALVFTADGSGDGLCATVTRVEGGKWERLAATPQRASLGGIYSNTTRFLGMKILEHEYKVMGLAPYAKGYFRETYERLFRPVIRLKPENPLVFESSVDATRFYEYLVENAVGERFDNLAAAVQFLVEELVVEWVRHAIRATGIRRIFTGGGLFMNVKLNRRLQELDEVEKAFFMPSCGDESNPIGAAYAIASAEGVATQPLENLYLGVGYTDEELAQFLREHRIGDEFHVVRETDVEERIAQLLAEREVVARFAGRCEWGARSLGNRAILAHPSHMESFYTVNDLIKARDFWMPFAPTILDTAAARYLAGYDPGKVEASYMITAMGASDLGVRELRAALHQGDHTLRPQVLTERANPSYYRLISAFERRTGVGAVLNTSFNLHGYPLVATPEQAIRTLRCSGLRHLALGPFLISKH